jgi:tetratricopeptide (TPR) repeat protein
MLAVIYNREPGWGTQLGKDAFPMARALAKRAIQLAPGLGWAQGELAWGYARFDYDWSSAEQASLKALALAPDNSGLHVSYAVQVLLPQSRFAEAQQQYRKTMDINPTDHLGPSNLGALYYYQRQFQEALAYFDQAVELERTSEVPRLFRARTLEAIPVRRPEAIREFKALLARPETGRRVEATAGLAVVLARSGQEQEARDLLAELLSHQDETCAAVSLAWVYTALGDHEKAIHWLEVGYERRDPWMIWIKVDPRLEPLQGERGFRDILKLVHLEP